MNDAPMTEEDMLRRLTAVTVAALEDLEDKEIHSANLAVNFYGKVAEANYAFKPLLKRWLIREDGIPKEKESLVRALAYEANRRAKEVTDGRTA